MPQLDQFGDLFGCHPNGARLRPELLAPAVLARAHRAVPPLGFARRARLAERQAILIEGVTRFVTRDARCNSVMQAGVLLSVIRSRRAVIRS